MMKRLLHRCNTPDQVMVALERYEGFEIDVRLNAAGEVVIGHDADDTMPANYTSNLIALAFHSRMVVAINVKSHGMATPLAQLLAWAESRLDYFIFDVPGVELPVYRDARLRVFGRVSAYESQGGCVGGYLMDFFTSTDEYAYSVFNRLRATRGVPMAAISHGCHGRLGQPNNPQGLSYLIGKAAELDMFNRQGAYRV